LHHCDVRHCVRPDHLFLGTHTENMQDAARKGRLGAEGARNSQAKLSELDVLCIRRLRGSVTTRVLGKAFGITSATVSNIHTGRIWKHVSAPAAMPAPGIEATKPLQGE